MGKSRLPTEMQKGHLTVVNIEKRKAEESSVKTGKNQLRRPPVWLVDDVAVKEYKNREFH